MELQGTFTKQYANLLESEVQDHKGIERYTKFPFDYDKHQVLKIPNVERPSGLLESMLQYSKDSQDFDAAKLLYNAYRDISLLQASDFSFWTYLSHVDLYEYVRARYPKVKEEGFNDADYINNHWFWGFGNIYHPLYGLWWDIHQTYDESADDPFVYSKYLFKDYNLRTSFLGRYVSFRNKEQVIGILTFMMDNDQLFNQHFRQRFRYISQYFNRLGATKQLISLDRDFFSKTLEALRDTIETICTDEDVKNS